MLIDVVDEDQDFDDIENEEDDFFFEMRCESDLEESEDEDNDAIYIHHFWDGWEDMEMMDVDEDDEFEMTRLRALSSTHILSTHLIFSNRTFERME